MIGGAHLASHLRKSDLDCSHRQVAWMVKSEEEKQTSSFQKAQLFSTLVASGSPL